MQIDENIYNELERLGLLRTNISNIEEMRNKDGIYLYRVEYGSEFCVLKYFLNEEFRREIENYNVLRALNVPTINVIGCTDKSIFLEDLENSEEYRLGVKEDLSDIETVRVLAKWYIKLHDEGAKYVACNNGKRFYRETDSITKENIEMVKKKSNTEDNELWDIIIKNFDSVLKKINSAEETLTYNDFYWTNLAVSRDRKEALMFDYNFLGIGFRYNDVRNVCASLSEEAGKVFLEEYGHIDEREKIIDEGISILFNLIAAYERPEFPNWAQESLDDIHNGKLKEAFVRILDL